LIDSIRISNGRHYSQIKANVLIFRRDRKHLKINNKALRKLKVEKDTQEIYVS
jgi:hypothetical protein